MAQAMPSWFGLLKIEAGLAMTFINIASAANPEKFERVRGHALKALAQIQRGLMEPDSHGLSEDQIVFLEHRRAEIELALAELKTSN